MKVVSALKIRCSSCYFVKRKRINYVLCKDIAKHKQRQG